jgi:chromosome segregation ATPase
MAGFLRLASSRRADDLADEVGELRRRNARLADELEELRSQNARLADALAEIAVGYDELAAAADASRKELALNEERVQRLEKRARAFERMVRVAERLQERSMAQSEAVEKQLGSVRVDHARLAKQVELDSEATRKTLAAIVDRISTAGLMED